MDNEQILKTVGTSALATGGKLNPEQADKFIDLMMEASRLLSKVQLRRMNSPTAYVETLGIGSRLIRTAQEGTAPTETATVNTAKKTLTTVETILPVDITFSFLEDNIERAKAEDHIMGLFAKQFALDTEDLAINGDTADNGASKDFLNINNGWLKILKDSTAAHKVNSNAIDGTEGKTYTDLFKAMLAALPDKYKWDLSGLLYLVSPSIDSAYRDELSKRGTNLGDLYLTENKNTKYKGIEVFPISFMPAKTVLLCNPLNLAYGIQRDITVAKTRNERRRVMEYTITARTDFEVAIDDAVVLAYDQGV